MNVLTRDRSGGDHNLITEIVITYEVGHLGINSHKDYIDWKVYKLS